MLKNELYNIFINTFPFWDNLSDIEQQLLYKNTSSLHYKKGNTIYDTTSNCSGVIIVKSGHLRTYILSEEARDVTLYRLFPNDICILSASCILDSITFDIFIDAEEDTDIFLIDLPTFHKISENNIYIKCFTYELIASRFSDVMWTIQQILFIGVDKRLAIFLWKESIKTKNDYVKITHEQIARYIGSAREVVSRMLKYFSNEGILKISRGKIHILNKEKLYNLTELNMNEITR